MEHKTQQLYSKFDRYIITVEANSKDIHTQNSDDENKHNSIAYLDKLKIIEILDMVTKEKFNKIDDFEINNIHKNKYKYIKNYYDDEDDDEDVDDVDVDDEDEDEDEDEDKDFEITINHKIFSGTFFFSYHNAFMEKFIINKQYLLFENGYSGIYREYYPNGILKLEYYHNNGLIDGVYKAYDCEGYLINKQYWINGLKHGDFISYYKHNVIRDKLIFVNDKEEGIYTKFYANNQLDEEYYYVSGKKEGSYKKYYENGKIKLCGKYIDHKREGNFIKYDSNGNLIKIYNFIDDKYPEYDKDHPPSRGGLMQLVAYGPQDVYLTGNPEITYLKKIYK